MNSNSPSLVTRRTFLEKISAIGIVGGLSLPRQRLRAAAVPAMPPVAVFSKVYQELNLDFEESAALTAEVGFDGIDCPLRPGGEVLPERVTDDLPRYAEVLAAHQRKILLLTTAIVSVDTPHAEAVLSTAAQQGIKYYRLGYWRYRGDRSREEQLSEIKPRLRDLAAMNQELGICGLLQNHTGADYVGAKVRDYWELVRDLDPAAVSIAFDLGHALNELGENWKIEFDRIRSHFAVAYVKDVNRDAEFVPFGSGVFSNMNYFGLLKQMNYQAPFSLHTEYNWDGENREHTKERLATALKSDLAALHRWWREQ